MGATSVSFSQTYASLEAASAWAGQKRSARAASGKPEAVASAPPAMSEGSSW